MFDIASAPFPDAAPVPGPPDPLAPLQQSSLYAWAVGVLGGDTRRVTVGATGAWLVRRRLPLLGETALISRGPRRLSPGDARSLRGAAGARHLIVNAEDEESADALASAGFWRIARPRWIAELPLSPSADTMAAKMTGKWRNRLRHGLSQGLTLDRRPMPSDPRHWLLMAEQGAARRLGYRPLPPVMISALAAAGRGAGQLFVASGPDGPVAAMLFFRHGRIATYQAAWSNAAGRAASAGTVLMWQAMLDLQAMGAEMIDLGHADPVTAPGLARFKCGAGARLRSLGGTWVASTALPRRRPPRPDATPLSDYRASTIAVAVGPDRTARGSGGAAGLAISLRPP